MIFHSQLSSPVRYTTQYLMQAAFFVLDCQPLLLGNACGMRFASAGCVTCAFWVTGLALFVGHYLAIIEIPFDGLSCMSGKSRGGFETIQV